MKIIDQKHDYVNFCQSLTKFVSLFYFFCFVEIISSLIVTNIFKYWITSFLDIYQAAQWLNDIIAVASSYLNLETLNLFKPGSFNG